MVLLVHWFLAKYQDKVADARYFLGLTSQRSFLLCGITFGVGCEATQVDFALGPILGLVFPSYSQFATTYEVKDEQIRWQLLERLLHLYLLILSAINANGLASCSFNHDSRLGKCVWFGRTLSTKGVLFQSAQACRWKQIKGVITRLYRDRRNHGERKCLYGP